MTHLTEISIDKLRVHRPWHAAPIGTLLQIRTPRDLQDPQQLILGMRCQREESPLLLVLTEGPRFGMLFFGSLKQTGAVDLSEDFDVGIKEPMAEDISSRRQAKGTVYLSKEMDFVAMAEIDNSVMYVHLRGANKGKVISGLSVESELGQITVVPKIDRAI